MLERLDAIAQPGRLLVAEALGEVHASRSRSRGKGPPSRRSSSSSGVLSERASPARLAGGCRSGRAGSRSWSRRSPHPAASGRRRAPSGGCGNWPAAGAADQPELLQRGLELGAQDAPLDAVERQGRLHRRPLALASEVRAQTGPQVARAADVQHLTVAISEEVHTGSRGGSFRERPLVVDPTFARRRAPGAARPPRPSSWASPIRCTRISAVASASGRAR